MIRNHKNKGFTVTELIITIVVATILLGIASLASVSMQVRSKDNERKSDVEDIVTFLDSAYTTGYRNLPALQGAYPSTEVVASPASISEVFEGIDEEALRAPSLPEGELSLTPATNDAQTEQHVRPAPTIDTYVYQPLTANDTLCTLEAEECRKFNIFYRTEADNTIHKLTSKHR